MPRKTANKATMPLTCTTAAPARSAEETLKTIDMARVDRRTRQARQLEQTMMALETDPQMALKALLRGCLATGSLLQSELMTSAQQRELIDADGRLPDSLGRDLIKIQRNLVSVASLLGQLEGAFPARKTAPTRKPKKGATVAEIILADDGDDGEGDE